MGEDVGVRIQINVYIYEFRSPDPLSANNVMAREPKIFFIAYIAIATMPITKVANSSMFQKS